MKTLSPWKIGKPMGSTGNVTIRDSNNNALCVVTSEKWGYPDTVIPVAEAKDNAHLIVAAPELLEALEHILGESDFHGDPEECSFCGREKDYDKPGDDNYQRCDSDDCPSFIARAAIAKAKAQ